jgi:hypothetical protein
MCDPVRKMSSIRQERAYQVQPSGRHPSWSGRSSFIYGNCVHQFNLPDVSLQGPDAPSLIMVISCSRSVTVRTLGQHRPDAALYRSFQCYFGKAVAVDRPDVRSSRPDTLEYFGHNFLLKYQIGTKSASLESLEKCCNLSIQTDPRSVRKTSVWTERFARPDGPSENSRITFRTRKTWPVRTALASVWTRVFQTPFFNRFWISKAYK